MKPDFAGPGPAVSMAPGDRDRRRRLLKMLLILLVASTGPVLCSIYYLAYY